LSAWLPSAALVLIVGFLFQLSAQVNPHRSVGDAINLALAQVGKTSLAGVVLISLVIIVSTMITQAFSFEAIRLLEGYWGTSARADRLAGARRETFEGRWKDLKARYEALVIRAWSDVEQSLPAHKPRFTRAMSSKLRERITGSPSGRKLSAEQTGTVEEFDWEAEVDSEVLRQLRGVEAQLADYPRETSRIMPTRLGNVLRRYETETGADDIEGFVERVYHSLPFDLQLSHDEQRARLDVYCSMVFVLWFCALVAVARFGWWAWPYTLTLVGAAVLGSFVAYRAAVASARYYGSLLVSIAGFVTFEDEAE
jgi:hypothetical protein